jgi:hypothetical protein
MFGNLGVGINQLVKAFRIFVGYLEKKFDRSPNEAEVRCALTEDIDCRSKFGQSLE